jgi:hypothetical protein
MLQTSGNMVNPVRRIGMTILTPNKRCSLCGEIKPLTEFHRESRTPDGHKTICKKCRSIHEAKWIDPQKVNDRAKKWYQANKEKGKTRARQWVIENRDRHRETKRQYARKHPDQSLENLHRRLARKRGVTGGHFTEQEWQALLVKYGHKCLRCGRTNVKLERDHVIPLGPPHSDEIGNIQPLCRSCNAWKGRKVIDYR